jgi:hypothetical protein
VSPPARNRGHPPGARAASAPAREPAQRARVKGGAGRVRPGTAAQPARGDFLEQLVHLLDSQFRIPVLGVRFGLDPLFGLVPGVGDVIAMAMGLVVLTQARREGARAGTLARMAANLLIDLVLGSVPLVGDAFDVWFKANRRNLQLLQEDRARRASGG